MQPTRGWKSGRSLALEACVVLSIGLLAACGGSDEPTPATTTSGSIETVEEEIVREGSDDAREGVDVTREEAEQIALAEVGEGRVTWSGPEDDRGAAWEVEVTLPNGGEVDVLVAAVGTVVKVVEKAGGEVERDYSQSGSGGGSGAVISRQEAEQAALAFVGEGRVTWVGREDERGAAWEVEITRPNGSEIDVLVRADGSIVN